MSGVDAWWECELCEVWLDIVGPLLVDPAEWERRRQIAHERKALLALTGLALGALLGAALVAMPQAVWGIGLFLLSVLYHAVCLLVGFYIPLALLAIFIGTLTR